MKCAEAIAMERCKAIDRHIANRRLISTPMNIAVPSAIDPEATKAV